MCVNLVSVGDVATEIRAYLLEGWRKTAGDPYWAVTRWITADGVPAGLRRHLEDCGIPRAGEFGTCADDLIVDPREFQGYASVEADDDGYFEVQRFVDQAVRVPLLVAFIFGRRPVLSRFGIVWSRNG